MLGTGSVVLLQMIFFRIACWRLPSNVSLLELELMQLKQDLQTILMAKEQQEDLLRKRERELTALKGALKEEVSSHDQELDRLKEQHDQELQVLKANLAEAVEVSVVQSTTGLWPRQDQESELWFDRKRANPQRRFLWQSYLTMMRLVFEPRHCC